MKPQVLLAAVLIGSAMWAALIWAVIWATDEVLEYVVPAAIVVASVWLAVELVGAWLDCGRFQEFEKERCDE